MGSITLRVTPDQHLPVTNEKVLSFLFAFLSPSWNASSFRIVHWFIKMYICKQKAQSVQLNNYKGIREAAVLPYFEYVLLLETEN